MITCLKQQNIKCHYKMPCTPGEFIPPGIKPEAPELFWRASGVPMEEAAHSPQGAGRHRAAEAHF